MGACKSKNTTSVPKPKEIATAEKVVVIEESSTPVVDEWKNANAEVHEKAAEIKSMPVVDEWESATVAVDQKAAVITPIDPLTDPIGAGVGILSAGADAVVGGVTDSVDYVTTLPNSVTKLFVCGEVPAEQILGAVPEESAVRDVKSQAEFTRLLKNSPGLTVVDFYATWCGPCRKISPFMDTLASKYSHVNFMKVDVDEQSDIAAERNISAMPTFQFFVAGNMVDEMLGANAPEIESKVILYSSQS